MKFSWMHPLRSRIHTLYIEHAMAQPDFQETDSSLKGVRILSVALNLPGPAALMRLAAMT